MLRTYILITATKKTYNSKFPFKIKSMYFYIYIDNVRADIIRALQKHYDNTRLHIFIGVKTLTYVRAHTLARCNVSNVHTNASCTTQ